MRILERDTNVDNLVLLLTEHFGPPEQVESQVNLMADIRKRTSKPVMVVVGFSTPEEMQRAADITKKYQEKGIPAFASTERGAFALKNTLDYYSSGNSVDTGK